MRKICVLCATIFTIQTFAQGIIRDYQTTRTQATAGAGVGSVLMVDAMSLNPASSAFFTESLAYLQYNKGSLDRSPARPSYDQFPMEPKGFMLGLTDASNMARGGLSYQQYEENQIDRKRLIFNMASEISASSAVGFSYSYTKDEDLNGQKENKHRGNLGYFHIINQKASFGLVFNDITETKTYTRLATLGGQYAITSQIVALADVGYNYSLSFSGTLFYRLAAQLKFYEDYIVRVGYQDDKNLDLKGSSLGLSWLGPRFSVDLSYSALKPRENLTTFLYSSEKITESSISFTIKM